MRSYLVLGMCGIFLLQYFIQVHMVENLLIVVTLIAFIASATKANSVPRWLGCGMLILGFILELEKGTGIEGINQGIRMNLPLLSLVILVPLVSIPLKLGGYLDGIYSLLQRLKDHPQKLFAGITSVLFVLSPILNIGSIRIVDELLKDMKLPPAMLAKSYLLGFSTTMLWSPYSAAVAVVLYYLKVPMTEYLAYGFGIGLLFLLIGNVLFAAWLRHKSLSVHCSSEHLCTEEPLGTDQKKFIGLGLIIISVLCSTFAVEALTHWSMLVIVSLVSILFPLFWAIFNKGWHHMIPHLANYRDHSVPIFNNEIVLIISAGLLGNSIQDTSIGNGIRSVLNNLETYSFFLFAIVVVALVVSVTFAGIPPLVIVTALATQMNVQELDTSNTVLAMLLLLAWSISSVLSPMNPLNLLVSRLSGISGFEAGLGANGVHLLIVEIVGSFIITIIH